MIIYNLVLPTLDAKVEDPLSPGVQGHLGLHKNKTKHIIYPKNQLSSSINWKIFVHLTYRYTRYLGVKIYQHSHI